MGIKCTFLFFAVFFFFFFFFLPIPILSKWSYLIWWHWFTVRHCFQVMVPSVSCFPVCHLPGSLLAKTYFGATERSSLANKDCSLCKYVQTPPNPFYVSGFLNSEMKMFLKVKIVKTGAVLGHQPGFYADMPQEFSATSGSIQNLKWRNATRKQVFFSLLFPNRKWAISLQHVAPQSTKPWGLVSGHS